MTLVIAALIVAITALATSSTAMGYVLFAVALFLLLGAGIMHISRFIHVVSNAERREMRKAARREEKSRELANRWYEAEMEKNSGCCPSSSSLPFWQQDKKAATVAIDRMDAYAGIVNGKPVTETCEFSSNPQSRWEMCDVENGPYAAEDLARVGL